MWTLIIIVYFGTVDIDHVPGFATQELCVAAARLVDPPDRDGVRNNKSAYCVRTQ